MPGHAADDADVWGTVGTARDQKACENDSKKSHQTAADAPAAIFHTSTAASSRTSTTPLEAAAITDSGGMSRSQANYPQRLRLAANGLGAASMIVGPHWSRMVLGAVRVAAARGNVKPGKLNRGCFATVAVLRTRRPQVRVLQGAPLFEWRGPLHPAKLGRSRGPNAPLRFLAFLEWRGPLHPAKLGRCVGAQRPTPLPRLWQANPTSDLVSSPP